MDWTVIKEFIRPELFILVVFLWVVGLFLKLVPTFKDEWKIPFILWIVGLVFSILYIAVILGEGWTGAVVIAALIQGTLIAGAAVFGNELSKQFRVKRSLDRYK